MRGRECVMGVWSGSEWDTCENKRGEKSGCIMGLFMFVHFVMRIYVSEWGMCSITNSYVKRREEQEMK